MQDFVPNGTGNSRFLKSVATFLTDYPTYADFAAALIAGTFPIDLNGVNPAGYSQLGTPLNKANLLDDATATALGISPATVNAALYELSGRSKIQLVTYTGTGTYGSANPNTLTFNFPPKVVFVVNTNEINFARSAFFIGGSAMAIMGTTVMLYLTWSGNSVSWYSTIDETGQMNLSGAAGYAVAIG